MSMRRISSRLQKILHSLATRVPKVVLHRAEDIFPALNTSLVSILWLCLQQSAECFVFHAVVMSHYYIQSLLMFWILDLIFLCSSYSCIMYKSLNYWRQVSKQALQILEIFLHTKQIIRIIRTFIYSVVCLTTSPQHFPKRVFHTVRSSVSSFCCQHPLFLIRSSCGYL